MRRSEVRILSAPPATSALWRALGRLWKSSTYPGVTAVDSVDPLYVDLIIRRFETETGENAVLMETGETRRELAARRARTAGAENRSSHKD